MNRIVGVALISCVCLRGTVGAAQSGDLLQQALYAEQIEGNLEAAIADYEKVINDASSPDKHVAQALYHQAQCFMTLSQEERAAVALARLCNDYSDQADLVAKAKPMLDSIQIFDPAALMPPETLAYLELGSIGHQLETVLEMLKGTPLEDPLLAISQMDPDALREGPGPLIAGLLNPAMKEDFKKIQGLSVGLVDITQEAPSMVGVLHLGESSMLRGLLMTGLSIAARPGPVVEGVQTYSIEGQIDIACDDQVFLASFPGGRLPWMIRQYKHLSNDASLASNNPSFQTLDKAARQKNLATLWINTDDAFVRIVQLKNDPQIGMAGAVANIPSIDDLTFSASLSADTIGIDGCLRFKEGMQNMIYEVVRTPAISRNGMAGVPANAVGLLSFNLADSASMQAAQLRQLALTNLGMDLPAELIDSLQQITLFALPYDEMTEQAETGMPAHFGIVIQCKDMTPVIPFVDTIKPLLEEQELYIETVGNAVLLSALDSTAMDAAKATLAGALSVVDGGALNATINQRADSAEKLALINLEGVVRWAGSDSLYLSSEEMNRQLADSYENLGTTLGNTTLSIHTEEDDDKLVLQARLSDIPEVQNIVAAVQKIVTTHALIEEKMARVRAEERQQADAERQAALMQSKAMPASGAPVIDGEQDEVWRNARVWSVEKTVQVVEEIPGSAVADSRFGADVRMLWDDQNLYVFMDVTDSTLTHNPELGWQFSDNAILYIDATNSKSDSYGPTAYEYAFCWDAVSPSMSENKHGRTEDVVYKIKTTEQGYTVEARFPWATLGTPNPDVGTVIGVDVQVSDNQSGAERNRLIGWQDDTNGAWLHPSLFRNVELAGLVGYWPCDEMMGGTVADKSGHSHDGIFQGNAKWAEGRIGGALDLDGQGSYVLIQDEAELNLKNEITIACWVNIRSVTADWMPFITKSNDSWRLSTGPNQDAGFHLGLNNQPSGARVTTQWPGTLGEWHHVTATYGSDTMRLYVDGKLWAEEYYAGAITPNSSPVTIGANLPNLYYDGLIDEVRVYNHALSADEVETLASAGKNDVEAAGNKKQAKDSTASAITKMIDLAPFSQNQFAASDAFPGMANEPVYDGLTFAVSCEPTLFGKQDADRGTSYPQRITGIVVGGAFDELHLLHRASWEEVQGCPVAIIRLHYEDGSSHDFEIKYGVHLSDWNRLPSEAEEILTDPDSKIVWRGAGIEGGTARIFKTMLRNPHPDRVVKSMDLFSTGTRVSYRLLAATVASSDSKRVVTLALPLNQPAFHFDGSVKLTVLDGRTEKPVPNADVFWFGRFAGYNIVAPPQLTGTNGVTVIKYPTATTDYFNVQVTRLGYNMGRAEWNQNNPAGEITVRLFPREGD